MQRQQQLYELDYHAKQYQTTITRTSDNIEFARLENDDEIFILSDNEGSDTDSETNEYDNESINNIYTQPLASANEWRKTVMDWIEMIENELQDQDNELVSITDTYDISIENIEQIQHPAIDPQAKCKLKNIFIENLELPGYLEDFIIGKA
ncbi:unnamed protein product [Rhizophagus irregularis]|uniref:Uncharacterized protein n=1 Tax=Rhizophagus irregularis TaxID=588596 RepID=A0A915YY07_9GLOM|nr:unnamed protein product [Rhizophagus irregularis]